MWLAPKWRRSTGKSRLERVINNEIWKIMKLHLSIVKDIETQVRKTSAKNEPERTPA